MAFRHLATICSEFGLTRPKLNTAKLGFGGVVGRWAAKPMWWMLDHRYVPGRVYVEIIEAGFAGDNAGL
jgi:hypothetical protein